MPAGNNASAWQLNSKPALGPAATNQLITAKSTTSSPGKQEVSPTSKTSPSYAPTTTALTTMTPNAPQAGATCSG